jgi:arsenate reductase
MNPRIQVLTSPGCPHAAPAVHLARQVAAALTPDTQVEHTEVRTLQEARAVGFPGSPTLRVNGVDIDPVGATPGMLACRVYAGGTGLPPRWKLEAAVLRALAPKHILFLCVANSARSQMAEGIARALAPAGVLVSSAGSVPTQVRPQAIEALREIGIDISSHRSKSVQDVDAGSVQAVITLCAEEVCPVFLGRAWRLHWGLADPAAVKGTPEETMRAFRAARDQLRERIAALFDGWPA